MTSSSASLELAAVSAYSRCCGRQLRAQQQLRHPDHAVERRADLVAHVGQELRLRARGLDGLGQRALALADVGAHRARGVDLAVGVLERELDELEGAAARGGVALVAAGLAAAQDLEVGDADRGGDVGREELVVGAAEHVDADLAHRAPPLVVDEQVAAVAVLDRDRHRRVVEDRLQAGGLHAEVVLAGGERRRHRVEGRAELADLADAGGGDARVEMALGEPLGRQRDVVDRAQDEAAQADAEQDEQQHGDDRAAGGEHDHPVAQRTRLLAADRRGLLLGGAEVGELAAKDRRAGACPRSWPRASSRRARGSAARCSR